VLQGASALSRDHVRKICSHVTNLSLVTTLPSFFPFSSLGEWAAQGDRTSRVFSPVRQKFSSLNRIPIFPTASGNGHHKPLGKRGSKRYWLYHLETFDISNRCSAPGSHLHQAILTLSSSRQSRFNTRLGQGDHFSPSHREHIIEALVSLLLRSPLQLPSI